MKIEVVGLGNLGIVQAITLSEAGNEVVGVEANPRRLSALLNADDLDFEPGLKNALKAALERPDFMLVAKPKLDYFPDFVFICVGTPEVEGKTGLDTSHVRQAFEEAANRLGASSILVGRSTVPVGTARDIQTMLSSQTGTSIALAWMPEFLREGSAIEDSKRPDRLVVGSDSKTVSKRVANLFKSQISTNTPIFEVGLETAELVKVAANAFLATKISFINSIAEVSEAVGADISEISAALGSDPRIGAGHLRAGLGFGGGCLPKDLRGLIAQGVEVDCAEAVGLFKQVDQINQRRRNRVVQLASSLLGELRNKRIMILGIAFKPNSGDLRDSPSLDIAKMLQEEGARITIHDPVANDRSLEFFPQYDTVGSVEDVIDQQDLLIVGTAWAEYKYLSPSELGRKARSRLVIDCWNILDNKSWTNAGWRVVSLGKNLT